MKTFLITGGAGFIGSHFVIKILSLGNKAVVLDKLTYAANLQNLSSVADDKNYKFFQGDIGDQELVSKILSTEKVDYVVNFAAESHVDNSINAPAEFINTNIVGTFNLLNACLNYWKSLSSENYFRFLHVSTDEIYGSLKVSEEKFNEKSQQRPNSPYSASKAASDHLVRAWNKTYGLPTVTTNCSNNYGPHQHKEKLIPTVILAAINDRDIPIYGHGKNIRDWIFVKDHVEGVYLALTKGVIGETYCFGGDCEKQNIEIVQDICEILDEIKPRKDNKSYINQITFVEDRPGHDLRYAINDDKAKKELGFFLDKSFKERLKETINYYI